MHEEAEKRNRNRDRYQMRQGTSGHGAGETARSAPAWGTSEGGAGETAAGQGDKTDQYGSRSGHDRLLLLMKEGDMEAFRQLYEETARTVYGYALSVIKNTQDAEEIMQDTYITVWNQVERYEPGGKPMAWIFTIARNLCYMRLRRAKLDPDVSLEELREQQEGGWEPGELCDAIEMAPEKQALLEAMGKLKEEERQLVILHDVSGMKHREIAEALDIPLSTVLSKYRRTIKKLEELLGQREK